MAEAFLTKAKKFVRPDLFFEIKKSEKRQNLDYGVCLFCFESGLFASGKLGLFKKSKKDGMKNNEQKKKKRG